MTTTSGALLVDKPSGWTSHDVIAKLRGALGTKRIGHAGTLDPMATGLLIVGVGPATRLLRFAEAEEKVYEGMVTFGVATDSLDADGAVTERRAVPALTVAQVAAAAQGFEGEGTQRPPMVSAVKVDGVRLHARARRGEEVDRPERPIVVHRFAIAPTKDPAVWSISVVCGPGTYVRVLASDLAERLGTVGHLSMLRRVRVGDHRVASARTLEDLITAARSGESVLLDPALLVSRLPQLTLTSEAAAAVRHGRPIDAAGTTEETASVTDEAGALIGVVTRRDARWWPSVVLGGEGRR